jgi:hypothetical protein
MTLDPFVWVAVALMAVFGLTLGWAAWITRGR